MSRRSPTLARGYVCRPYVGPRHKWRTQLLAETLLAAAPDGVLVDAGCGDGVLAGLLAQAGRPVVAFDPDIGRLRNARASLAGPVATGALSLLRGDARFVPLADGSVAGLAAGEVLEHVADDCAALRELARVVAPGGAVVLTVPAGAGRLGPVDAAAGHFRRYDRRDLEDLVRAAGLVVADVQGWGFPFGRLYDALVQRPALAARRGPLAPVFSWLGGARLVVALWTALFRLDERMPRLGEASGWLLTARKEM